MRTVYKYRLNSFGTTVINCSMIKILYVQYTNYDPYVWIEVDDQKELKTIYFYVIGTGWDIPENTNYVGTYIHDEFVWHIYCEII